MKQALYSVIIMDFFLFELKLIVHVLILKKISSLRSSTVQDSVEAWTPPGREMVDQDIIQSNK